MSYPALRLMALLSLASASFAAQPYPPSFDGARTEVYKTVGDTKLALYIFEPATGPKENRPAIVFFFGGGWTNGSPVQFEQHCRYLASRGMVAITADYRVASRQNVKIPRVTRLAERRAHARQTRRSRQRRRERSRRLEEEKESDKLSPSFTP